MENWRAGLIGIGILLIGFGGYASLDGVWKGVSLVAAGVALVLLGLSLDRGPRPAAVTSAGTTEVSGDEGPQDEADAATMPMAAVAIEEAEETAPLERVEAEAAEPEPEPSVAGLEPEAVEPAAPAAAGAFATVAEDRVEAEPVEAEPVDAGTSEAPGADEAEEPVDENAEEPVEENAHVHDQPMLGHSELVSHIRDYHPAVPFDGSTIQLRLLHERAHG